MGDGSNISIEGCHFFWKHWSMFLSPVQVKTVTPAGCPASRGRGARTPGCTERRRSFVAAACDRDVAASSAEPPAWRLVPHQRGTARDAWQQVINRMSGVGGAGNRSWAPTVCCSSTSPGCVFRQPSASTRSSQISEGFQHAAHTCYFTFCYRLGYLYRRFHRS